MLPGLVFYKLILLTLLCLCVMLHVLWPAARTAVRPSLPTATPPRRKRSKAPKPFAGLIHKPLCEACEQAPDARPKAPGTPPPLLTYTRGRKRAIDTQQQFYPDRDCTYFG